MNFHLRPYNQYILNIVTNIYLGLDFSKKMLPKKHLAFDLYNHQAVDCLNMLDQQYDEWVIIVNTVTVCFPPVTRNDKDALKNETVDIENENNNIE